MSSSATNISDNNSSNNSNSSNSSIISNSITSNSPTMQDLMNMLNDQARVIRSLQNTIEGLNITIKGLNDKIQKMKEKDVDVDKDVFEGVGKEVTWDDGNKVVKNIDINSKRGKRRGIRRRFTYSNTSNFFFETFE